MTNLQIGAQLYSVRDHCQDPAEMLKCMKEIKAIGYNICQLPATTRNSPPSSSRACWMNPV